MRSLIRDSLCFIFIIITFPFWGLVYCRLASFLAFGQLLSLIPGCLGFWVRRAYYVMILKSCAWDLGIHFGSYFSKTDVVVESNVSIGAGCIVGSCRIKKGTLIGSHVDILSGRHQHGTSGEKTEGGQYIHVTIGENNWIGNGCIVMSDVGDHCVIGAGSVVVHAIPDHSIAVGNPAVVKKVLSGARLD